MVSPFLYISSGVFVFFAAILAIKIYFRVKGSGKSAMASFQLKQEQAITDFKIAGLSGLPLLIGGIIYMLGGVLEINLLKNTGYTGGLITTIMLDYVLFRWWRRF